MSRKRERREGYATAKGFCDVTIREVEEFLNGKAFCYAGTVVNEKDEEIGLSLGFFDKTVPEEVAERWSLHCMKDGTLRIVEW